MGLKTFWNKLKYWQRGTIIGFVLSLAFVFLLSVSVIFKSYRSEMFNFYVYLDSIFMLAFVLYIIPATIAGSAIGWIIGKFIKK